MRPEGPRPLITHRRVMLVLGIVVVALLVLGWHWLPVSIAVPPSEARSPGETDGIASQLKPPQGFTVNAYATGLGDARSMALTPRGDIILSSPPARVLLIKADKDGDGRADGVVTLIDGLHNVTGLTLDGDQLYVAEDGRVLRAGFDAEAGRVTGSLETVLADLPPGGMHWSRTIKKGPDGFFYVSIGASCNVCIESNPWRAAIIRFKPGEKPELFASGLRNTVGFDWQPGTGDLYGVDNGRDWLGDDFPPEDVNRIVEGGFYGWPYLHGDNVPDPDYGQQAGDRAKTAIAPAYKLPAHVAPLSILFLRHAEAPSLAATALVAEHGSWNRSRKDGYQVVALTWRDGAISQTPFLTGFLKDGEVLGRPVDLAEAPDGTVFVSDDFGGVIWRVVPSAQKPAAAG
jgi:glucose/arabinose dehydrogenase